MKQRKIILNSIKKIILLVSVALFAVIAGVGIHGDNSRLLDVEKISQSQLDGIVSGRTKEHLPVSITFKGQALQYCRNTDSYYITQSVNNSRWQGGLIVSSGYKCRILDTGLDKEEIIATNTPLKLFVYNDSYYDIKNITVSGMPVLSIVYSHREDTDDYGQITVFEPDAAGRTDVLDAKTYFCRWHTRGATSLQNPKKSYKLNLLNSSGDSKKVSLMNMREDNDWVLNAMYTDNTKIREKLCLDMWNNLSGEYGHGLEYCELIIDGNYLGLYALQEPADNKTFGQSKSSSIMMYIKGWAEDRTETMLYEENALDALREDMGVNGELTLDMCKNENFDDALEIFRWIKNPDYVSPYLTVAFDRENLLQHTLLCNLAMADDNLYKNQKICAVKEAAGSYRLYKTPWDMDITFHNENIEWFAMDINRTRYDSFYTKTQRNEQELKEMYLQARKDFYNEKYLFALIDSISADFESTGAFSREAAVWGTPALNESCDYLKNVISGRIKALDSYYGGV